MRKIVVRRRGYRRKDGTYVKPTTYKMRDRGKPGKTPKSKRWYKPKRKLRYKGMEWHARNKASYRRRVLSGLVKRRGYATVVRELNALRNVTTSRQTKRAAESDMNWLRRKYGG
ncbi:MAG TPA: hypothetical protein ENI53_01285 [Thermoplasmatales archaeon]|nr:hypothetical protein [Thermoplasmatales archaeon]